MRIPIGCSIDRRTGERTDRYREGTAQEAQAIAEAIFRASCAIDRERRQAALIAAGKGAGNEER